MVGREKLVRDDGSLNDRAEKFARAYVGEARFNATEAARIVGYADPQERGWQLKAKAGIRARIDELLEAETLNDKEVLRELTAVATAPTSHYMQVQHTDPETGEAVSVRQDYGSKVKALELLGKAHKLFIDRAEVEVRDGDALRAAIAGKLAPRTTES